MRAEEYSREFARLQTDPCCQIPKVGDRVVVAVGLLGLGHLYIREECEVLECGATTYKIQHSGRDEYENWVKWVHQALIIEVLTDLTKGANQ